MSQPQKQDCHTLQRVDLARPFLVSPAIKIEIENSLEMALSKAKGGSAWQSHFWQCVEPCDLLETRGFLHYASKSKLGFVEAASFQRNSSARGCLCHPSCLLWFHGFWRTFEAAGCVPSVMSQPQKQDCHTLQRVDLARPFLVSPAIKIEIENSLEMALSKARGGSTWQSHFWQCVEPCDLLETRRFLHYASKSKLGFVEAASFQRNWGGPLLGVQKANVFTAPKMRLLQ